MIDFILKNLNLLVDFCQFTLKEGAFMEESVLLKCPQILVGTMCTFCASDLVLENRVFFLPEEVDFCPKSKGCFAVACSCCGQFYWEGTNKRVTSGGRYVCRSDQLIVSF